MDRNILWMHGDFEALNFHTQNTSRDECDYKHADQGEERASGRRQSNIPMMLTETSAK